jgi:acyl carrier protein
VQPEAGAGEPGGNDDAETGIAMTADRRDPVQLRGIIFDTLLRIAPECAPAGLAPARPLRDQVDLGSLDWTNFLTALEERLGVEIPETDWAQLVTLDDLLAYLQAKA